MKAFLIIMAIVFAIATGVLYNSSLNKLDSYTARQLGVDTTINIQATVFCAACAIMCIINIVGAIIISVVENNGMPAFRGPKDTGSIMKEREKAQSMLGGR